MAGLFTKSTDRKSWWISTNLKNEHKMNIKLFRFMKWKKKEKFQKVKESIGKNDIKINDFLLFVKKQ